MYLFIASHKGEQLEVHHLKLQNKRTSRNSLEQISIAEQGRNLISAHKHANEKFKYGFLFVSLRSQSNYLQML